MPVAAVERSRHTDGKFTNADTLTSQERSASTSLLQNPPAVLTNGVVHRVRCEVGTIGPLHGAEDHRGTLERGRISERLEHRAGSGGVVQQGQHIHLARRAVHEGYPQ